MTEQEEFRNKFTSEQDFFDYARQQFNLILSEMHWLRHCKGAAYLEAQEMAINWGNRLDSFITLCDAKSKIERKIL